jgi:predicted neuraminidase
MSAINSKLSLSEMRSALLFLFTFTCAAQILASEQVDATSNLAKQPGIVFTEFIFDSAPFRQCHASTIVETPKGFVAAWFGGTHEKHPDVGIWLSRHVDGRWTLPTEVANGVQHKPAEGTPNRYACWNPVLFQPKSGPLLLFYKVGPSPSSWWGVMKTSADHGATWSETRRLPEGVLGPIKNKPVQLANGTIVCPSSTEGGGWKLHVERTSDLGATWTQTDPLNDGRRIGAIQPSILFHSNDRWQILARDRRKAGYIWSTWSNDAGKTWSELESTGLPNPSSGIDTVTLADGRQLLAYNHTQRSATPGGFSDSRSILNVAVSDDGKNWSAALLLERSPGEYSYPAVIQSRDGRVHITYTWKRERIKHVTVDPAGLKLTPIVGSVWPKQSS